MSDLEQLTRLAMAGDRAAEDALITKLRPGVVAVLKHGHFRHWIEPEDLAQEALSVLVARIRSGRLQSPDKVPAFVAQTARKMAINAVRKLARQQTVVDSDLVDETALNMSIDAGDSDDEQLAQAVVKLLDEMPNERDRYLLVRFYVDGIDKPTLCRELKVTSAHFDRLLFRARSRFRELLGRELPDFGVLARLTSIVLPFAFLALSLRVGLGS
jgi:RNA polymerase sigma-70 factor, ECF subfamily